MGIFKRLCRTFLKYVFFAIDKTIFIQKNSLCAVTVRSLCTKVAVRVTMREIRFYKLQVAEAQECIS